MAFALVAHVATASTNGGASVTTVAIDTSGANLIVLHLSYYTTATAITDNKGNSWTLIQTVTPGSAQSGNQYYCMNPTVGAGHTWSTSGATNYPSIAVSAWSGSAASSALDQFSGSTGTPPVTVTPTAANELVIASSYSAGSTPSTPSGYTLLDSAAQVAAQSIGYGMAYLIQTSATATSSGWSSSGNLAASFKVAAAGALSIQYRSLLGVGS
jgi:hypothetical protein